MGRNSGGVRTANRRNASSDLKRRVMARARQNWLESRAYPNSRVTWSSSVSSAWKSEKAVDFLNRLDREAEERRRAEQRRINANARRRKQSSSYDLSYAMGYGNGRYNGD